MHNPSLKALHRAADLELADDGGIAPLPDDEYLRTPCPREVDMGALLGVVMLVSGAIGMSYGLARLFMWALA
jgi:hypothetical protein